MKPPLLPFVILLGAMGLSGCRERGSDAAAGTASRTDASSLAAEAKAREDAAAAREAERLAALWTYYDVPAGKGRQLSATIYSSSNVETDGRSPKAVRLVFRDHPSCGRPAQRRVSRESRPHADRGVRGGRPESIEDARVGCRARTRPAPVGSSYPTYLTYLSHLASFADSVHEDHEIGAAEREAAPGSSLQLDDDVTGTRRAHVVRREVDHEIGSAVAIDVADFAVVTA